MVEDGASVRACQGIFGITGVGTISEFSIVQHSPEGAVRRHYLRCALDRSSSGHARLASLLVHDCPALTSTPPFYNTQKKVPFEELEKISTLH